MEGLSIKGRNYLGYEIQIDNDSSDEQIIDFLQNHVVKNFELFKNSILTIKLDSKRETGAIINYLKSHNLNISAIFANSEKIENNIEVPLLNEVIKHPNSVVFKGNLRSGQTLESDDNLIIMGNVNRDAYIYAKKNIFVLGTLEGVPHAGFQSNKDTFVFAFELNSPQIRISDLLAKAPDKIKNGSKKEPEVAFVENSQIIVLDYKEWLNYKME
ncbi:Septum site-determining protein MinC [Desulfurella amilsii]|uniref:Probable septum site-determining protein MinC n=1 Tax=Desulfurella amilsii TaxID=1562698 RepID=A0A1X4XZQ1_9BACT|nr:septum site-determining protein MinC [Desulfurella amilsii]OSS43022.1 Septum site-determining protein MinC [Desulfurella amilsii]